MITLQYFNIKIWKIIDIINFLINHPESLQNISTDENKYSWIKEASLKDLKGKYCLYLIRTSIESIYIKNNPTKSVSHVR